MEGIYRKPTDSDMELIGTDLNKSKRHLTAHELFIIELGKQEVKATEKGLPFARHCAKDDFEQSIHQQTAGQLREYGEIVNPVKMPETEWKKYSDLKNFELIETKFRPDKEISKHNPGLNIQLETKVYRFKGYHNKYTVMESEESAIRRAQAKMSKARS